MRCQRLPRVSRGLCQVGSGMWSCWLRLRWSWQGVRWKRHGECGGTHATCAERGATAGIAGVPLLPVRHNVCVVEKPRRYCISLIVAPVSIHAPNALSVMLQIAGCVHINAIGKIAQITLNENHSHSLRQSIWTSQVSSPQWFVG